MRVAAGTSKCFESCPSWSCSTTCRCVLFHVTLKTCHSQRTWRSGYFRAMLSSTNKLINKTAGAVTFQTYSVYELFDVLFGVRAVCVVKNIARRNLSTGVCGTNTQLVHSHSPSFRVLQRLVEKLHRGYGDELQSGYRMNSFASSRSMFSGAGCSCHSLIHRTINLRPLFEFQPPA